jgi:chromosomal replication initiation ATPase DnaA
LSSTICGFRKGIENGSSKRPETLRFQASSSTTDENEPPLAVPALGPWDDLIEGPENTLALAGARALARGEREGTSPLVVHGPSGVGKSRLLAGLAADVYAAASGVEPGEKAAV